MTPILEEYVEIGRDLLQAFNDGVGIFKDLRSEAVNDEGLDRDLYLNYVTFTSAIDYRKNIPANDFMESSKEMGSGLSLAFQAK